MGNSNNQHKSQKLGTPTAEAREVIMRVGNPLVALANFAQGVDPSRVHPFLEHLRRLKEDLDSVATEGGGKRGLSYSEFTKLIGMAEKYLDRGIVSQEVQIKAASEASQYIAPKLKSMELKSEDGGVAPLQLIVQKQCPKCGAIV